MPRLVADSLDVEPSFPRLFICPDAAAGSRHFQLAPAAAGAWPGGGDGRCRLALGKTDIAGAGSRRYRRSQCGSGLRAAGFDHRPGAVSALSVPAGRAAISGAGRRGIFGCTDPGDCCCFLLHYLWVIYSDVAFEEASVEASQKLAVRIAATRAGNWQGAKKKQKARRPWFKLAATGPSATALFWKNLIGVGQVFSSRLWISIIVVVAVFGVAFSGKAQSQGAFHGRGISYRHCRGLFAAAGTADCCDWISGTTCRWRTS